MRGVKRKKAAMALNAPGETMVEVVEANKVQPRFADRVAPVPD
jgi:hypothetical protein